MSHALSLLLLGLSLFAQEKAEERKTPEIVTDRPDVTEAATVVPLGSLQFENGFSWTREGSKSSVDLSQTLMRYGLTSLWELRLEVPDFFDYISNPTEHSGFGDIAIGVKRQLGPLPGGFDLAVIAAVSIPSGAQNESSHGVDPFVKFPWSHELTKPWSVGGQFSVFYLSDNGRRNTLIEPCFYIEREFGERDEVFVEYAGDYHQRGRPGQLLHIGTAYKLTPRHQIDFHMGIGLSRAAPDVFVAAGYSFRLDGLFGRKASRGLTHQ